MKNSKHVLVVATSSNTRGGISAVINSYKTTKLWNDYNCLWIETHIDKGYCNKIIYFVRSLVKFIFLLPNACLVHFHLSAPTSAKRKFIYLVLAKLFRIPIIIHFHAYSSESSIDSNYSKLYDLIFNMASTIIVLSERWKKGLIKDLKISSCKIEVLYNPCMQVVLNNNVEKTKSILFAGTIEIRKGYKDLIFSFYKIAKMFPEWKLVFAGNGEINEGIAISKKLRIENQVVFKGWVSGIEKEQLFREANIFCLPSYAEGFPMAILDAWAYGLPVITTPVGGIPDVGKDGENMLLFKPGDTKTLSEKLMNLILDNSLNDSISNASVELSLNQFSLDSIINELNEIYKKNIH